MREREKVYIQGSFYEEFERDVKKTCKRTALSIGALLGNLEGVRLLGILREKENARTQSINQPAQRWMIRGHTQ